MKAKTVSPRKRIEAYRCQIAEAEARIRATLLEIEADQEFIRKQERGIRVYEAAIVLEKKYDV